MKKKKVYLTLQNGKVFQGFRFGADKNVFGELVFNTSSTGYLSTLTDPAYLGQAVMQTFPLIGNYGIISEDFQSDSNWLAAYIVREKCDEPSNFRSEGTLNDYLVDNGIVGVYGIDTRELTKIIRESGVMNVYIGSKALSENDEKWNELQNYTISNALNTVSCKDIIKYGEDNTGFKVALWDFGCKKSTINKLVEDGCQVVRIPYNYTAEQILSLNVDGVVLSDGPGNPNENSEVITEIKKLAGKLPMFGIGLGHLMIALAMGANVNKMKYGHRGGNQPVKDLKNGRVYISSQNQGYEVVSTSIVNGEIRFINVNDNTCEGIDYDDIKSFTVSFLPDSCCRLGNKYLLFDKFYSMMEKGDL